MGETEDGGCGGGGGGDGASFASATAAMAEDDLELELPEVDFNGVEAWDCGESFPLESFFLAAPPSLTCVWRWTAAANPPPPPPPSLSFFLSDLTGELEPRSDRGLLEEPSGLLLLEEEESDFLEEKNLPLNTIAGSLRASCHARAREGHAFRPLDGLSSLQVDAQD